MQDGEGCQIVHVVVLSSLLSNWQSCSGFRVMSMMTNEMGLLLEMEMVQTTMGAMHDSAG